jgi:hypothetical protein
VAKQPAPNKVSFIVTWEVAIPKRIAKAEEPEARELIRRMQQVADDLLATRTAVCDLSDMSDMTTHFESILQTLRRARASRR